MKRILALVMLLTVLLGCMVTSASAAVAVKSLKLNKTSISLDMGKTFQLKATISPSNASNKKVTFSSSNTKIATVSSSGLITAKSVGSYTITAKSNNNKKATITVKVTQPAVTSVKLDKTSINMLGKAVTLKATCQPSGSNQKVTWSTSNSKIATVSSSGVVTPKGYGTCTITAKSSNGKTAACTVTVKQENDFYKTIVQCDYEQKVLVIARYKMIDTFHICVDGLTGKITKADLNQNVSRNGIAILSVSKEKDVDKGTYSVDFRTTYHISFLGDFEKLGLPSPLSLNRSFSKYYRMDNQGNLTLIRYQED